MRKRTFALLILTLIFAVSLKRAEETRRLLLWLAVPRADTAAVTEGVHTTFHFDRNALVDSVVARDSLIALTKAGNLLRFERSTLRLVAERIATNPLCALTADAGGRVYAGSEDGTLGEVELSTLELRQITHLRGKVQWIGISPQRGGLIAVFDAEAVGLSVQDLSARRSFNIPSQYGSGHFMIERTPRRPINIPSPYGGGHFMIDRKDRLWMGMGMSESDRGGEVSMLDLNSGLLKERITYHSFDQVYGFVERPDGSVLAYGGTGHFGIGSSFVSVVDPMPGKKLYDSSDPGIRRDSATKSPHLPIQQRAHIEGPISQILVESDQSLLLLGAGAAFRSDLDFRRIERLVALPARINSGRPDAIGSDPAVTSVHLLGPDAFVCSTIRDGFVRAQAGQISMHALPGQMDVPIVDQLRSNPAGLSLDGRRNQTFPRSLRAGVWAPIPDLLAADLMESGFSTQDGQRWRVHTGLEQLREGLWQAVRSKSLPGREPSLLGRLVQPRRAMSPDAIREHEALLTIEESPFTDKSRDYAESVTAAIPWAENQLMVATEEEIALLDMKTRRHYRQSKPGAGSDTLCRDGLGRVWVGGPGLWISNSTTTPLSLRPVSIPDLSRFYVYSLIADPEHPDGVLASLGGTRGLIAVRVFRE